MTLTVIPADYSPYITVDKSDLTAPRLVYTDDAAVSEIIAKTGTLTFTLHNSEGETKEYSTQFTVELYVPPSFAEELPTEVNLYHEDS